MWPAIATIAGGLLGVIGVVTAREREPSEVRALRRVLALLKDAPDGSNAEHDLRSAADAHAAKLRLAAEVSRKVNPTYVALAILLTIVSIGVAGLLWWWTSSVASTGWVWLAGSVLGLWALGAATFTAVGWGQIRQPVTSD